jgi:tetratricopeptide (TPR) repeat protein
MRRRSAGLLFLALLLTAGRAAAGEPDWFTRVKEKGLEAACREEVARHEKGVLGDSLHVGECYYHLERYADGIEVFRKLLRSPDRNYAAAALVRVGEGEFHLGRKEQAKKTFERCLEQHPDAWLDGSIPELCRAWLEKLEGKLESPEAKLTEEESEQEAIDAARKEIKELEARLAELKKLIRRLLDE